MNKVNDGVFTAKTFSFLIKLFFGVIVFFALRSCFTSNSTESVSEPEKSEEKLKEDAFYQSQICVENQLKSPSTAEFPFIDEVTFMKLDDSTYVVSSHVDSQNSFGAMIRAKYMSRLNLAKDGTFSCNKTIILEQ